MSPARFELTILASDRLQTHVLDGAATGIGTQVILVLLYCDIWEMSNLN